MNSKKLTVLILVSISILTFFSINVIGQDPNLDLIEALKSDSSELANKAIDAGANPNYKFNNSSYVLLLAIGLNKYEFAKAIVKRGADVNVKMNNGTPAIDLAITQACEKGNPDAFEFIGFMIKHGANVNAFTANGLSPLCFAKKLNGGSGCPDIISLLEANGAILGDSCYQ